MNAVMELLEQFLVFSDPRVCTLVSSLKYTHAHLRKRLRSGYK